MWIYKVYKSFLDECKKRPKRKIKQFSRDKIILFLAEFVGTGILMFLGCMGCIAGFDEVAPAHQLSSLSFGLVVMLVIQVSKLNIIENNSNKSDRS